MSHPDYPVPIGILKQDVRPTYDDMMIEHSKREEAIRSLKQGGGPPIPWLWDFFTHSSALLFHEHSGHWEWSLCDRAVAKPMEVYLQLICLIYPRCIGYHDLNKPISERFAETLLSIQNIGSPKDPKQALQRLVDWSLSDIKQFEKHKIM